MIINGFKYIPFTLNFNSPFKTSSKTITARKGYILQLKDELGNLSLGECSPLPGFSTDNIEEAGNLLANLQNQVLGLNVEHNFESIQNSLRRFDLLPSLQFAFEQAVIDLLLHRDRGFINNLIEKKKFLIGVNAVIGFAKEDVVLFKIREKIKHGYDTFKIKVGREDINEDFLLIKKIRDEFGSGINIRLDVNRAWSSDKTLENICLFKDFNITYIEEPCELVCGNFRLIDQSPVPIALDESLASFENATKLINECNAKFIILKPMILGGIISSYKFIKEAGNKNKKVIISSSFGSSIGRSALVLLAAATGNQMAHGLDTPEYFSSDVCSDPYPTTNGKILFEAVNYPPQFDFTFL
ncbi:MAG: o-succinylbenzoate synthase [Ignavibacteriae bacterium HGW-Ignavibacteriae-3]|nr:MAG: o-succinylbenzoate synthase [Ignavibacteriae bacterium HGW-Ignavibacteriae-3]